jgi:hypothetical protein
MEVPEHVFFVVFSWGFRGEQAVSPRVGGLVDW